MIDLRKQTKFEDLSYDYFFIQARAFMKELDRPIQDIGYLYEKLENLKRHLDDVLSRYGKEVKNENTASI